MRNYISSSEFEKRCSEDDEVCVLAQALAEDAMGTGYKLSHKKEFIRQRYIDLAEDLIKKLKNHNLIIVHKSKNEDRNEK